LKIIYDGISDIDEIYKLNMNTYKLNEKLKKDNYRKLKIIKRIIQYFTIKSHIYKSDINYINTNDPFTFDLIEDIPIKERFIFNENENYYCFKVNEFKYFISTNGNWNPYTKKTLSYRTTRNVFIYIDYYNLENKIDSKWSSINQAYTDVSQSLEKIGFYTNMEWFLKLTSKQIKGVIKLFRLISNNLDYFININDTTIFYDFAEEIIKLFENGNSNFLLCFNFMKSLGMYSTDFYNSLPSWLSEIENPIILNNYNHRNYELVYLFTLN